MLLTELLTPDRIVVPLAATDKHGVLAELSRHLVKHSGGGFDEVMAAVLEREAVLNTGVGFGVAIPHARCRGVPALGVVGGRTGTGIAYDGMDGEPVRLVFMIVGPEESAGLHVKLLSRIARLVREEAVRRDLTEARTPDEFHNVLLRAEAR
ncbi:MAG TPA: PTS sugar transporter subunit IIA [Gemmatimonadales bacterium]|jgi:PTS system nitrogen regulatory IIA component